MNAIIDSYVSRDGYFQQMIYRYDGKAIYLSGDDISYIRAAILMGIKEINIYALNDGKMMSVAAAKGMKREMYETLALDYKNKRGKKPSIQVRVISPIDGSEYD